MSHALPSGVFFQSHAAERALLRTPPQRMWLVGLRSFPAVILGGLDSVFGAALGGILIGVAENMSEGYIGRGMKEIAGFLLILIVLMVRPYGLFGKPDIERV